MSNDHKASVGIVSTGMAVPERKLTNFDLEKMVDTSDEWIRSRTGIRERRIADENTATSDLAAEAGRRALKEAGLSAQDLDALIVATATSDHLFPSTACAVQDFIGASNAASFDVGAACSGFIYGLTLARSMLNSDDYENILLIGAETLSKITDFKDRSTCVIFGDGAGAAVVSRTQNGSSILSTYIKSDGTLLKLLNIPAGGTRIPATHYTVEQRLHYIKMEGNELFKVAVRAMEESVMMSLKRAGLEEKDIDLLIPHQANVRIINAITKRLKLPEEKVMINIDRYGNTSAASIPIALDEAKRSGRIKPGDIVMMAAFGGGVTWGSAVLRW